MPRLHAGAPRRQSPWSLGCGGVRFRARTPARETGGEAPGAQPCQLGWWEGAGALEAQTILASEGLLFELRPSPSQAGQGLFSSLSPHWLCPSEEACPSSWGCGLTPKNGAVFAELSPKLTEPPESLVPAAC